MNIFVFEDDHTNNSLIDLPEEMIENILTHPDLSYNDLKRIRLTSYYLSKIADAAIEKTDKKCKSSF